mmetsp:Transcript_16931/g.23299  ORF Transcript_16931/g.23299 Transcript_16931/m.23299 type:complete len:117 (+) Transcript_16931:40-390(+)
MDSKREQKRQINQIMLGDTSISQSDLLNKQAQAPTTAIASTIITAPVMNIPNPVQQFLSQRLEPKPLVIRSSQEKKQYAIQARGQRRRVDQIGGYSYVLYDKRNWMEIFHQLKMKR